MKFSLFYLFQLANPTRGREAQLFRDCLAQCERADELGYDCIWAVEHHGLYEYSHSSAPEVFLSFVAARTERVRIGHGVTLLPQRYNHPIRVAERIATLDLLSGGRVNWGTGKSSSLVEQRAFECDIAQLHDEWEEALRIIPQMWAADVFSYRGKHFDIPPTQVLPKPVQEPHPPMFAACSRAESVRIAGRLGVGALNFSIRAGRELADKVADYRAAVAAAMPLGRLVTNHFACTPPTLCLADDRQACEHGFRGARFFAESLTHYTKSGRRPIGTLPISRDALDADALTEARAGRNGPNASSGVLVGDPVCVRESVSRYAELGVDELILVMQMGTVPSELVMTSLETFAEHVMPWFA